MQHDLDFSKYVDVYGEGLYTLEFDIKATKEGTVYVYTMNGNSYKYSWGTKRVNVTTDYRTYKLDLDVFLSNEHPDAIRSMLAFWGGGSYESEILPTIKNVKLYKALEE